MAESHVKPCHDSGSTQLADDHIAQKRTRFDLGERRREALQDHSCGTEIAQPAHSLGQARDLGRRPLWRNHRNRMRIEGKDNRLSARFLRQSDGSSKDRLVPLMELAMLHHTAP